MHTYVHGCIHTYIHACIHAYIHTYVHTYMHGCMHACIHAHLHTYIDAYTHTHTHYSRARGTSISSHLKHTHPIPPRRLAPAMPAVCARRPHRGGRGVPPSVPVRWLRARPRRAEAMCAIGSGYDYSIADLRRRYCPCVLRGGPARANACGQRTPLRSPPGWAVRALRYCHRRTRSCAHTRARSAPAWHLRRHRAPACARMRGVARRAGGRPIARAIVRRVRVRRVQHQRLPVGLLEDRHVGGVRQCGQGRRQGVGR
jgi:hypothetical protein